MTEMYRENLRDAQEYQDFVVCALYKRGIVIPQLGSKKYQIRIGESLSGFEIKLDRRFRETGNLYFEYKEKSDPQNEEYVMSGFLRDDNTWMWAIGDYEELWLVPKQMLKRLYDKCIKISGYAGSHGIRKASTPTSRGMLVPTDLVTEELCADHITFEKG